MWSRAAGQAGAFFVSRAVNGALGLLHVFLCLRAAGDEDAARFFLAWTAAWLIATLLRFGADGVLPRVVAEAQVEGRPPESLRSVLCAGAAASLVALVPIAALLGVSLSALDALLLGALGAAWAVSLLAATQLKACGRVALSGAVANVLWPLGTLIAPAVLLLTGASGGHLLAVTVALAAASAVGAVAVAAKSLGVDRVRGMVSRSAPAVALDRDVTGAALLTWLYELMVWLPVVLAALTGQPALVTGAVFAASRVAGVFSWGYQAVVATLTPLLAGALARGDEGEVRRLLARGSVAGAGVTLLPCLVGAAAAGPVLAIFEPSYDAFAWVVVWLAIGRLADSAAGPVGEALLVGRRAMLDAVLTATALCSGAALALTIEPAVGPAAIGAGAAVAFAVANVLRILAVHALLTRGWGAPLPRIPLPQPGWLALAAAGAISFGVLAFDLPAAVALAATSLAAVAAAAGSLSVAAAAHGARLALTAPVGVIGAVLIGHFVVRPLVIALDPGAATLGLRVLGFELADIAEATAIGVLGMTALATGFLALWRSPRRVSLRPARSIRLPSRNGLLAAAGLGTSLWGVLFWRLGGLQALVDDPAALHLGQFGGGYGTVGLALCFAAALLALHAWYLSSDASYLRVAMVGALAGVLGSVVLATRGPLIASLLAAMALFVWHRPVGRRTIIRGGVAVTVIVLLLGFGRAVRDYAQASPLPSAVSAAAQVPPHRAITTDLVELDHLVALSKLVPSTIGWLDGSSFSDVPGAFLPRAVNQDKALPVDFSLSEVLYGPETVAGTPFTLAGEAYWNFGYLGGALAMLVIGMLLGLAWRGLGASRWVHAPVAAAIALGYSYLLLTRPLAAMSLTLAMALAALGFAVLIADPSARRALTSAFASRRLLPPSQPLDT